MVYKGECGRTNAVAQLCRNSMVKQDQLANRHMKL